MQMTTKQAFEQLTSKRGWYKDLDMPEPEASSIKNRYKTGKLSIEKMEEVITRAGYKVIQEKKWEKGQSPPIS